MKNVNNMVRGLLVVMLAFVSVVFSAGVAFAANESMSLPLVDARVIVTNGATNYVSDFNSTDVLTLDISASTISQTTLVGDAAYRLSFADGNLFVAAGKYDSASTYGGLQVLGTSAIYGKADTYTYSKVFAVSGGSAFAAFLDDSYIPFLEKVSYDGSSTITPISDVALDSVSVNDITALTVSGGYAYVGIQDGSNAGYVNVVDTSTMLSVGTYVTSDAITSVTAGGGYFYAGHGNTIDVVNTSDLTGPTDTIDVGALVNDLTTDGNYLYVATENGLQVYALDLSFVGEYNTSMSATAVSVDGTYIYLATSDGTDSEIFKIEMVVITLTGANPQTIELGAGYTELGATVSDGSTPLVDTSDFVDAVNSVGYAVTYTAVSGNPGLQVTRTVKVVDTVAPVITLLQSNIQTIRQSSGYTELGATTDDGSPVQIDATSFVDVVGSYTITYDAIDASGNRADQVTRRVNVIGPTSGGGGSSGGGSGGGSSGGRSGPAPSPTGTATGGQVLGAEKFIFTLFLKKGQRPYPMGAYANEVMELQKFLTSAGFNSEPIDGKFGPITNAAVVKFQLANGLVGDGKVGPLTRAVLNR